MANEKDWYEHTGVVEAIARETIQGRNGEMMKVILVLSAVGYEGRPEHLAVEMFGKSSAQADAVGVGETVTVSFRARSREGKGRWFTSANAFGIKVVGEQPRRDPLDQRPKVEPEDASDDMPF